MVTRKPSSSSHSATNSSLHVLPQGINLPHASYIKNAFYLIFNLTNNAGAKEFLKSKIYICL
jgi:hypothetical protein